MTLGVSEKRAMASLRFGALRELLFSFMIYQDTADEEWRDSCEASE